MISIPTPPASESFGDGSNQKIRFRLSYVRHQGKFSAKQLKKKQRKPILKKLRYFEQMTLSQFKSSSSVILRQYNGRLPGVPEELSGDVKDMLAQYFRINDKIRLYGYLFGREFQIIWIDAEHKLSDRKSK